MDHVCVCVNRNEPNTTLELSNYKKGNVSGANQGSCANLLKKVSKNSEKNHECDSQLTSSIYKILWSNSSYSKNYKKEIF